MPLTQDYLLEREQKKKQKTLERKIMSKEKEKLNAKKPLKVKSQKYKLKSDYKKVCCDTFWEQSVKELRSVLSGRPADCIHHIRWKIGKLRDDPYNLMPLTYEEHAEHHRNRTFETKTEQAILLRNAIDNVKVQRKAT